MLTVLTVSCDEKVVLLLKDVFAEDVTEGAGNERAMLRAGFLNTMGSVSKDLTVCFPFTDFVNFADLTRSSESSEGRFLLLADWESEET